MLWLVALVPMLGGIALFAARAQSRPWLGGAAAAILVTTILLAVLAAIGGWSGSLVWSGALRLEAALTPLSAAVLILVPAIAMVVAVYASAHEDHVGLLRLIALLLFFTGAMELLVVADDLLTLLIGWELVGACSWALIGHEWRGGEAAKSANYAFVITRFGDLGLFLAAMATFAGAQSFAFADISALPPLLLALAAGGILLSAASKSGQVPFSPWLFRAMAGPTSVSALLHAATMVAAGAYLLARLAPLFASVPWFGGALIAVGLVTALAGGVVGIAQFHAKKLLAASTSAHFGLMLVAVGAGYPGVAILHLIAHACFKAPLFLAAGIAGDQAGTFDLRRMRLGRTLPWTAALTGIAVLALAGLPPLGGGWTKDAIVSAAETRSLWIALGVIMAGGLSAAYAAKFYALAFGRASPGERAERRAVEVLALAGPVIASVLLSLLWLSDIATLVGNMLATAFPERSSLGFLLALAAVIVGLLSGAYFAASRQSAWVADWLGLPTLIDVLVIAPVARLSLAMAYIDKKWVDRGVDLTSRFTKWVADIGGRFGERLVDEIPGGTASIVSWSGKHTVKVQTGLSHQYYTIAAVGAGVMFVILMLGA